MNKQKQEVTNKLIHLKNNMKEKIHLLGNSALVKRDKLSKKTSSGLILGDSDVIKLDTGVITHISENLKITGMSEKTSQGMLGVRVRFKESFAEKLDIGEETYLYFRDLEPSIYYVIEEKYDKE